MPLPTTTTTTMMMVMMMMMVTVALLVQELLVAKRELRLARLLKRLSKFRPLIIDDID